MGETDKRKRPGELGVGVGVGVHWQAMAPLGAFSAEAPGQTHALPVLAGWWGTNQSMAPIPTTTPPCGLHGEPAAHAGNLLSAETQAH